MDDIILFNEDKESKLSDVDYIIISIPNELEYKQILHLFNKKYPSRKVKNYTAFYSKYFQFVVRNKNAISDYEKIISSREIRKMMLYKSDYFNKKISE